MNKIRTMTKVDSAKKPLSLNLSQSETNFQTPATSLNISIVTPPPTPLQVTPKSDEKTQSHRDKDCSSKKSSSSSAAAAEAAASTTLHHRRHLYSCRMARDNDGRYRVEFAVNRPSSAEKCATQCLFEYLVDKRESRVYDCFELFLAKSQFDALVFLTTLISWALNCVTHEYPGDLIVYGLAKQRVYSTLLIFVFI